MLGSFDVTHATLTLTELADRAGLPVSTVHSLVAQLEAEGLLERTTDRRYRLGVRLWELASSTPGAFGLREVAHPWLQAVHARIRHHTHLAVRSGTDVLFLDRLSEHGSVVSATVVGGRIPLHAVSVGLAILSWSPASVLDDLESAGMRRYTSETVTDRAEIETMLARTRASGIAVSNGCLHLESRGIAAPILGTGGGVIGSIGVIVPNDAAPVDPYSELLRVAARSIERRLAGENLESETLRAGISDRSWNLIEQLNRR